MPAPAKSKESLQLEITDLNHRITSLGRAKAAIKRGERYQRMVARILEILNHPDPLTDSISAILFLIKKETRFDAVGIRLRSGDDFPYFNQIGFSHDFLLAENALVSRDTPGEACKDENGKINLECICGLVISGRINPENPGCTAGGSLWTNNSPKLLESIHIQGAGFHPRGNCVRQGYLSIAMIPIRARGKIVGLLQLNDRRKNRFTLSTIRFFEGIGASIGVALVRKQEEGEKEKLIAELKEALSNVRILSGLLPICASCKKIRDDNGYWNQIEAYIKEHSDADFSHGICPDCAQKLYPELFKKG
jgi:hypothetical protein